VVYLDRRDRGHRDQTDLLRPDATLVGPRFVHRHGLAGTVFGHFLDETFRIPLCATIGLGWHRLHGRRRPRRPTLASAAGWSGPMARNASRRRFDRALLPLVVYISNR